MTAHVTIGPFQIGDGHPSFVVAEAGINHNGSVEVALRMVAAAKQAGASAIKFQTFTADELIVDQTVTYTYRSQGREVTESMHALFKRHEFPEETWARIKAACDDHGILFFTTPQNPSDLEMMRRIGVPAIKIGSDDFTNIPLVRRYRQARLPLILSCGMADLGETYRTLEAAGTFDGHPVILLVCTSQYPAPPENLNLSRLTTLRATFPDTPVGFSDHSRGTLAAGVARALGACVFEKHFTLDRNMAGPDHWFSADPAEMAAYVATIQEAQAMLGTGEVRPTVDEVAMRKLARRSVAAAVPIGASEMLSEEHLTTLRPGTGLPPEALTYLVGRRTARAIARGALIALEDLA